MSAGGRADLYLEIQNLDSVEIELQEGNQHSAAKCCAKLSRLLCWVWISKERRVVRLKVLLCVREAMGQNSAYLLWATRSVHLDWKLSVAFRKAKEDRPPACPQHILPLWSPR